MKSLFGAVTALACLTVCGCASPAFFREPVPVADQADMLNRAAADAERLMIVRNVMRARDRSSMVFTRLPQLRGSMTRSVSNTFGLTLNEGSADEAATAGLTVGGESNPSFDLQVMNDEKFNRALYSSIDLGVYELLQEYGWPRNLLHMLFIERVEIGNEVYENDPEDWGALSAFSEWLNGRQLRVCHAENPQRLGPPVRLAAEPGLEGFAALAEQRLSLRDAGGGAWQIQRARTDRFFSEGSCDTAATRYAALTAQVETGERSGGQASGNVQISNAPPEAGAPPATPPATSRPAPPPAPPASTRRIVIRSLQGVLYYVGEVVRAERGGNVVEVTIPTPTGVVRTEGATAPPDRHLPIFVVQEGVCPHALTFEHDDGLAYSIPRLGAGDCESRDASTQELRRAASMDPGTSQQVISLMIQLVGMIQSGDERPATAAVQVVN